MADEEKPVADVAEESNVTETEEPEVNEETKAETDEQPEDSDNGENDEDEEPKGPNLLQRLIAKYKAHKKYTIPATVALLLVVLFALPLTRYGVLGLAIRKDVQVTVIDSQNNVPVSGVDVSLRGKTAKTDGEGRATIRGVRVGSTDLKATKKHYKDAGNNVVVGLKAKPLQIKLEATGRQVPVHIVHKITGQNIAGAIVRVADTEAQTDQNGETTVVLPASQQKVEAKVAKEGYNELTVQITAGSPVKENTFGLVPNGKVYFLSKKTGKIDVVKTDLDGSNRETVLAGTGNEEDGGTILLAARDWRYLALHSRRDGTRPKLYLIDTTGDKLTEIDSGDATFNMIGWSEHNFVYTVTRNNVKVWQPKQTALKSFNAGSLQLQTLDETTGEGVSVSDYASENISNIYILKDTLVYTKAWNAGYYSIYRLAGKRNGIVSIKANGGNKQTLKDFDAGNNAYFNARLSEPGEIYFGVYSNNNQAFYEYSNGKVADATDFGNDAFNKFYPTYLVSPSGNATFWYEPRDGKNTLLTGNADGQNGKEIASLNEYIPYGWYTDDYLLMSKNNSELYVQPAGGAGPIGQVVKISDYHKPSYNFAGYGYGYGGF